ncbi:DUF5134 domain-containing protein [Streptomyces albus]
MHGSATVGWLVAALCAVTGVWCLLRARGGSPRQRADAGAEATMGFGMAAMAVPALWDGEPVPAVVPAWCSVVFFGGLLVRESAAAVRDRGAPGARHGHAHHVIGAAAMVYMALAMAMGGRRGRGRGAPRAARRGAVGDGRPARLLRGLRAVGRHPADAVRGGRGRDGGRRHGRPRSWRTGRPGGTGDRSPGPAVRRGGGGCRLAMAAGMFAMLLGV